LDNEEMFRDRLSGTLGSAAKRLLPEVLLREVQQYRAYGRNERSLYLKIRISQQLGFPRSRLSPVPKEARSFLFVCWGNIMRSPMCEELFKRELAGRGNTNYTVVSAGLNAMPGRPAHSWAIAVAKEFGISLERHRARLLTTEMVAQADLVLTMDYRNQVHLLSQWPGAKKKAFLLGSYNNVPGQVEIRDP
jgi:protein-tyrosine phosphatase